MIDPKLLTSIASLKSQLDQLRPFPKMALERLHNQFILEWTFNSNAIEGNTLTLKETALVLNEGLTISGKPLREHFEAVNHKEAILQLENWIQSKQPLNEELILYLHKIILRGISDIDAGNYRQYPVRILGALHVPPNPMKVPRLMKEFLTWFHSNERHYHPIELATEVHYKLVYIHPFIDGNGRCARLLMNLILMQKGYPPAIILKLDRKKYYHVLKEADQNRPDLQFNFIARSVERSLLIYLEALTPASKAQPNSGFNSLSEAAKNTPYSQEYLSLLARKGRLSAVKFGRNWMTTHEAVRKYHTSKKPRKDSKS